MPPAWPSGACRGVGQPAIPAPTFGRPGHRLWEGVAGRARGYPWARMLGLTGDGRRAAWWRFLPPGVQCRLSAGRRPADWLADSALFGFAVVLGGITQGYLWHVHGEVLDTVGLAAGVGACLALWWRRAHPMAVFVLVFAAALFSPLAQFAALVAVCTAASRVRGRALIAVVVTAAAASVAFPVVNPAIGEIVKVGFPAFLVTMIAFGWGLYARPAASWSPRCGGGPSGCVRSAARHQRRRGRAARIAREMPTCWPTGCRCSACMPGRWNSGRMRRRARSPGPRP